MMKMATEDGFPSPAGYWNVSRLIFHRYRELRQRSGESRVISDGFYIYRNFWRWFHAKMGHEVGTIHQGAPGGLARPGGLCPPRGSSGPPTKRLVPLLLKKSSKSFEQFQELSFSAQKQHHGSSAKNSVSPG